MRHPVAMIRRSLAAVLCCTVVASMPTAAEAPRTSVIAKLRLGDTPDHVVAWLKKSYPQCDLQRSLYHALPGETARPLAIVAINEGTMNVCLGTPEGSDSMDVAFVRFAHPTIAADRGVYELLVERRHPDPLLTPQRQVRYTLDRVLKDLRGEFGRPIDEERKRVQLQSSGLAASLNLATGVKRDDQTVRLMWGANGKLAHARDVSLGHGHAYFECSECGDRFVIAEIDVTRSPLTRPPNQPYVTRVSVFAQNADVRGRQEAWNAQWLQQASQPRARPERPSPRGVQPAPQEPRRAE